MTLPDYRELFSSQIPALHVLMALGYEYLPPDDALRLRGGSTRAVVLTDILAEWLHAHNGFDYRGTSYAFTDSAINEAIRRLHDAATGMEGLVRANERVFELLTLGTSLDQAIDGDTRSYSLHYVDWQHPERNWYHVTEEYTVERARSHQTCRPDIVCFVNGIPFAIIECKRPDLHVGEGGLPYEEAVSQMLRNQGDDYIPHLFVYTQVLLAVSKNHARYATTGTPKKFWCVWQEEDADAHEQRVQAIVNTPRSADQQAALYDWRDYVAYARRESEAGPRLPTVQDRTLVSLLDPARLLELTYQFVVFDGGMKKIARYQQYYAIKATLDRVVHLNAQGERTGGVIWHTTGSGKSLTMVLLAKALALHPAITNPRVILVTDRINLDDQIWRTFVACGKSTERARSGRHLIELVQSERVDIIATVINKFETVADEHVTDDNPNVFVLVDESHRGQYGLIHGKMRKVFTRACYIGFTGTPLTKGEKTTAAQFGSFIHKYPMRQAVNDEAVVPLLYEGRMVDLEVDKRQVDRWFDRITRDMSDEEKVDLKRKMSRAEELHTVEHRIQEIAVDLSEHYRRNFQGSGFKAQLATSSKAMALKYKRYLDDWDVIMSEVVISAPDTREGHEVVDDPQLSEVAEFWQRTMQRYGSEDAYNREILRDFHEPDGVELLIVVDKLLVGFDEPRNTVLYIDKPLKDHAILQAIARVNRLFEGKDFGYIIDYRGILGDLNAAMETYDALAEFDAEDVAGTITDIAAEIAKLPQLHSDVWAVFRGVDTDDGEAMELFLEPEDRRQQFYDALTAYSRCLKVALSAVEFYDQTPESRIDTYKRDLKRFHNLRMAVKLRYAEAVDYREYEQRIRKLLDSHITADGVTPITAEVEIFDRAAFNDALDQLGTPRARAEAILRHLKRTAIEQMEQDPAFYRKFSQLIDDTLAAIREGRLDDLEGLQQARDLREQAERGHADDLPHQLTRYRHAPAYYGLMREILEDDTLTDHYLAEIAIQIEEIIEAHAVRDWSQNQDVQNAIWIAIEDLLYDLEGIDLHPDDIELIVRQTMETAKRRQ